MAEAATVARPYAKAAFLSARDTGLLPSWSKALGTAAALVGDQRIALLLNSPRMTAEQVASLFAGLGDEVMEARWFNFTRLLVRNKRLELLPQIAVQYELLRAQHENELDVAVTSAVAMNPEQERKLAGSLAKRFKRNVRLHMTVDASLLGGAVIRAGDLVIDGSINGRLQRLASELGG